MFLNNFWNDFSAEHLTMAASAGMTYVAIDYENERNMKVAASIVNIKIH